MNRVVAVLIASLLVAACGQRDTDPGPGGVTIGEAKALDQAASMLDRQRLPQTQGSGATPAPQPSPPPARPPKATPSPQT